MAPTDVSIKREDLALLRRYEIAVTPATRVALADYRERTHRARWRGAFCAVVAGATGLLGSTGSSTGLILGRLVIGYLVGSVAAELFSPRRRATGPVHAASLTVRRPDLLLPGWARVGPWLLLAPCLTAPLVLIGDHPTGRSHWHSRYGHGFATAWWFSPAAVFGVAGMAAAGMLCWRLALAALARRPLPSDDPDATRLDLLTRALSARAVSGSAAVLGLCLMAGMAQLVSEPSMSMSCVSTGCHYLYGWRKFGGPLQHLGMAALLVAVLGFAFSRMSLVDRELLRTPQEQRP